MRNELRGVNLMNEPLWLIRQVENHEEWEGTGVNTYGIPLFADFRAALQHFLIAYPGTDTISGVIEDQYRFSYPNNASAITILDAIATELGQ